MKILVHDYAGHPFQIDLSRELARRGHDVLHAYAGGLLTPRGGLALRPDDPPRLRIEKIPTSPEYIRNKYNFIKRRGYEIDYGRELIDLLRRDIPDVVISSNTPTESQLKLVGEANALRIPVVHWLQDFYSIAVSKLIGNKIPLIGALIGSWYRRMDRCCLMHSRKIIAITEDFIPILNQFGAVSEQIEVIPNWAPLDDLPIRPRENPWSKSQGLDGKFVFHYSGTLAMKHNPELIASLARHFLSDELVRIIVISEGPGADYLQERKKTEHLENLILLPFQPFEMMPDALAASDVLLAVLEADAGIFSVPSKVLSYHAAGKAILASMPQENLASKIIMEQKSGKCVPAGNIHEFVKEAVTLRENADIRETMGRASRFYAEKNFDIQKIGSRFEEVIINLNKNKK